MAMRVTVITGPPAGGKTTFVQEHCSPGDVVIDFDALAAALLPGLGDHPDYSPWQQQLVLAAWKAAAGAAQRLAAPGMCWLIHGNPPVWSLALYRAHGQVLEIDPGPAVVMARLEGQPHRQLYARQWYGR